MKIYIVIGNESEPYETNETWIVAAYKDKNKAEEHALLAKKEADIIKSRDGDKPNPYDPDMLISYDSNTSYFVEEYDLIE